MDDIQDSRLPATCFFHFPYSLPQLAPLLGLNLQAGGLGQTALPMIKREK